MIQTIKTFIETNIFSLWAGIGGLDIVELIIVVVAFGILIGINNWDERKKYRRRR